MALDQNDQILALKLYALFANIRKNGKKANLVRKSPTQKSPQNRGPRRIGLEWKGAMYKVTLIFILEVGRTAPSE